MNDKDQKLQRILELAKIADALTATQAKEYVQLLVNLTQKQKEALVKEFQSFADTVSQETFQRIKEGLGVISEKHADALLEVRQLSNKQKKEHEARIVELQTLLDEIKSIEVRDGKDADEEVIVEKVLSQIKLPEIKEVVLDNAEQLRDKLETLEGEDRLDAKAIKNLPESVNTIMAGAGGRLLSQMNDVDTTGLSNDKVLKWDATRSIWVTGTASGGGGTWGSITGTLSDQTDLQTALDAKQATLVSGTNIKTINGTSLLGSGDVTISGVGTATANEIAYWDTTTSIASLTTAAYPSLTELSYVKGVTSAIQTQLDGKIDGTMVLNRIPYGSDSNTLQTSANLIFDGNQLIVETDSSGVIPAIIRSSTSAQTASLLEVRRYDASPGLTVGADTQVTLGGAYDYVNAKHATQHILRYSSSGVYSGKALKLNDLYTGSTTRLHSFNNGLYITDDTGTATPLVLGIWANPSDGTHFSTNTGQWRIESGKLVVNRNTWSGVAQLESSSTTLPQLAGFYDISNYLTVTTGSTGSTTFALTGTSPTFTFSQNVTLPTLTTTGNIELGHASDTTIARVSAGVASIEGFNIVTLNNATFSGNQTQTLVVNTRYLLSVGLYETQNLTLPSTFAVGDEIEFIIDSTSNAGTVNIILAASDNFLYVGDAGTTVSTTSNYVWTRNGSFKLVCTVANTTWEVVDINGSGGSFSGVYTSAIGYEIPLSAGTMLFGTNTATVTNKRIQIRQSSASNGNITPDLSNFDYYIRTALSGTCTIGSPTGTPVNGEELLFRFKDNGTARTLSWNAIYRAIGVTIPTTTVISKTLYVKAIYNSTDTKWDVIQVNLEA